MVVEDQRSRLQERDPGLPVLASKTSWPVAIGAANSTDRPERSSPLAKVALVVPSSSSRSLPFHTRIWSSFAFEGDRHRGIGREVVPHVGGDFDGDLLVVGTSRIVPVLVAILVVVVEVRYTQHFFRKWWGRLDRGVGCGVGPGPGGGTVAEAFPFPSVFSGSQASMGSARSAHNAAALRRDARGRRDGVHHGYLSCGVVGYGWASAQQWPPELGTCVVSVQVRGGIANGGQSLRAGGPGRLYSSTSFGSDAASSGGSGRGADHITGLDVAAGEDRAHNPPMPRMAL